MFFIFGGTSAGTPQWAGLAAIARPDGAHRLGDINPALYAIAHGAKHYADVDARHHDGQQRRRRDRRRLRRRRTGWDAVTGLGTPNAAQLLPQLIKRTGY